MIDYFNDFFNLLNQQDNNIIILISFSGVCLLDFFLRIIICIGYQTNYSLFKMSIKEYKSKSEVKNTRSGLLNKTIKDFIKSAEKNISSVNTPAIIQKYISRLNIIGWSYMSIESFITGFEQGIVIVAAALAVVFYEYRFVYGLLSVASFIITRIIAGFFDYSLVKEKLCSEMTEYVDREIGQFFAGDTGSIILRFKTEMTESLSKQADILSEAMHQMGNDLTGMLRLAMQEMTSTVESSASTILGYADVLQKPLADWREALIAAEKLQVNMSGGLSGMKDTTEELNTAVDSLKNVLSSYTSTIISQTDIVKEQMTNLTTVADGIQNSNHLMEKSNEKFTRQLAFIEQNQTLLEKSIEQYELSLENMARKLGDGFGNIVEFHMQSSYNSLNEGLQQNVHKVINSNNEMIMRLQQLFDSMLEQSRNEMAVVMKIKEQMELYHGDNGTV